MIWECSSQQFQSSHRSVICPGFLETLIIHCCWNWDKWGAKSYSFVKEISIEKRSCFLCRFLGTLIWVIRGVHVCFNSKSPKVCAWAFFFFCWSYLSFPKMIFVCLYSLPSSARIQSFSLFTSLIVSIHSIHHDLCPSTDKSLGAFRAFMGSLYASMLPYVFILGIKFVICSSRGDI